MSEYDFDAGAARPDCCRLLAACYYQPGPEFAEEKVFESMLAAASRLDAQLAEHVGRMAVDFAATGHERLLLDYTGLFLGPTTLASPYESVWAEDSATVMGKSTLSVLDLYRDGGFELDDTFRGPPDHVACELEFLYLLLWREHQGRAQGDRAATASAMALRRRLLDEHIGKWIFWFTAAVASGAGSAFYRELALATDRFVRLERGRPQ